MDKDFEFIDMSNITEDRILEVLESNRRACILTKQEVKKLKEARKKEAISDTKNENTPIIIKEENKKENDFDISFEEEIEFYLAEFKSLDISEFDTKLEEVLPVRKNYNYEKIIYRLMAEMIKEIKDINDVVLEEDLTLEDSIDLKEEVEELKQKIKYLKRALKPKCEEEKEEEIKNKMVFLPTTGGNLRIFDDLKAIPEEYYESFLELFKSIEDGTFKNIKKFINHDLFKGIYEVKNFKTRVVFTRLSSDCYVIITAIMKKSDNDRGYRKPIELKIGDYRAIEDKIKAKIEDDEFIKHHEDALQEVYNLLDKKDNKDIGGYEVL